MGGRLKKRGLDRDTVATQRALQDVTALSETVRGLGTTVDDIDSFAYDLVTVDASGYTGPGDNPYTETIPVASTEAVISSCDDLQRVTSFDASAGTLTVTVSNPVTLRFVVF